MLVKELMLEGVCGIVEGMNPRLIRIKLEGFLSNPGGKKQKGDSKAAGAGQAAEARG